MVIGVASAFDQARETFGETARSTPTPADEQSSWSRSARVAFRFAFVYLALFMLDQWMIWLPWRVPMYDQLWRRAIPWFGANVLRLATPITTFTNGSGDTRYDYVQLLCFGLIAAVAAFGWSVMDRRRKEYRALYHFLRNALRYTLGYGMVHYGIAKVIPSQFPPVSFERLMQTYGASSPMGLVWTFMSASRAYSIFAGALELTGVLLFFRRTTTLGALIGAGVLSNVVMLNYAYDVPVKILSTHLFVIAIALAAPQLRRVLAAFVDDHAIPAERRRPHAGGRRARALRLAAKTAFIGAAFWFPAKDAWASYQEVKPKPYGPFLGVYDVVSVERNGVVIPPLLTDSTRWRRLGTGYYDVVVQRANDSFRRYDVESDQVRSHVVFTRARDSTRFEFSYATHADHSIELRGVERNDSLRLVLRPIDTAFVRLTRRGFHWVNEQPFYR